ncbi:MAG: hypothetical protein K6G62_01875 [Eubacterium sp.]|nr:hypothetical protein [Eubacterium sp.]
MIYLSQRRQSATGAAKHNPPSHLRQNLLHPILIQLGHSGFQVVKFLG